MVIEINRLILIISSFFYIKIYIFSSRSKDFDHFHEMGPYKDRQYIIGQYRLDVTSTKKYDKLMEIYHLASSNIEYLCVHNITKYDCRWNNSYKDEI